MSVIWELRGEGWQEALPVLKLSLNGYMSGVEAIYVGASDSPEGRWAKWSRDPRWERMVVVYDAFTGDITRTMEQALIAHAQRSNSKCEVANRGPGGEWIFEEGKYIYFLLGARRSTRRPTAERTSRGATVR